MGCPCGRAPLRTHQWKKKISGAGGSWGTSLLSCGSQCGLLEAELRSNEQVRSHDEQIYQQYKYFIIFHYGLCRVVDSWGLHWLVAD